MYSVGVNALGNDVSVAIVREGGPIIALAEEERYSGVKGSTRTATLAWVLSVLDEFSVAPREVAYLAFPRIQAHHRLRGGPAASADPLGSQAREAYLGLACTLTAQFPNLLSVTEVRHHSAHAASAMCTAVTDDPTGVTCDGVGEVQTAGIHVRAAHGLRTLWTRRLPHSLGLVYEAVADWLGLAGVEKEGKLMGLSAYGHPTQLGLLTEEILDPVSFELAQGFGRSPEELKRKVRSWLTAAIGDGAAVQGEFYSTRQLDIAASVQKLAEEALEHLIARSFEAHEAEEVACAGGVFMNSLANGKVLASSPYRRHWVPPFVGDAGSSLGAALLALGLPRVVLDSPFLGSDLGETGSEPPTGYRKITLDADWNTQVARWILDGWIIGWVEGRSEVGPRALGHRSILANSFDPQTRDQLNRTIKQREAWRPFAPIVLEEDTQVLFGDLRTIPYMNMVLDCVTPEVIPSAVHVDFTARVQTVGYEPAMRRMRQLLLAVKAERGYGVAINTSLNVRGMPIARSLDDVARTALECSLHAVVMDGVAWVRTDRVLP
jgi:carbamoyltransferase